MARKIRVRGTKFVIDIDTEHCFASLIPSSSSIPFEAYIVGVPEIPAVLYLVASRSGIELLEAIPVNDTVRALRRFARFADVVARDLFDGYLTDSLTFVKKILRSLTPRSMDVENEGSSIDEGRELVEVRSSGLRKVFRHVLVPQTSFHTVVLALQSSDGIEIRSSPCICSYAPLPRFALEEVREVLEQCIDIDECLEKIEKIVEEIECI